MPTPPLDQTERQAAIAQDEKYLDARFLGEVPIKDKRGAIIEKRWLFFAGAYYGVPVTIRILVLKNAPFPKRLGQSYPPLGRPTTTSWFRKRLVMRQQPRVPPNKWRYSEPTEARDLLLLTSLQRSQ